MVIFMHGLDGGWDFEGFYLIGFWDFGILVGMGLESFGFLRFLCWIRLRMVKYIPKHPY